MTVFCLIYQRLGTILELTSVKLPNHGKHNTQELAEKYSKEVLAPALGNTEGKRYRYLHIFSIFHNGGYLYHNGGNYYYAKIVKWNQYQYESYEKIIHLIE